MLCPNCENDNREGAKFCDECGFPLPASDIADKQEDAAGQDEPYATTEIVEEAEDIAPEDAILAEGEAEANAEEQFAEPAKDAENEKSAIDDSDTLALESAELGAGDDEAGEIAIDQTVTHEPDLAGFDLNADAEYYGERMVDSSYVPPSPTYRDGGTMQMPKIEGEEAPKSKDYRASSAQKRKPKSKLIIGIVVAVVIIAALVALATYQMQVWGGKVVPDVSGMTEADARSILIDEGFDVRSTQVKSDETEGLVLLMDPQAGSRVDEGAEVVIHIATTRTIPDIMGKKKDEAAKALEDAGYENVKFTEKESDKAKDTVIKVKPKEGERAKSTADVTVTIAKPFTVPDVSGLDVNEAITTIEKAGLGYEVVYYDTPSVPEGTVVSTEPAAGTSVKKGDYIVINVAQSRGDKLVELAASEIGEGMTIDKGGSSYIIESLNSISYIGDNTVSYTATAREYVYIFGSTVTNPSEETISGTVVFDDNDEIVAIS